MCRLSPNIFTGVSVSIVNSPASDGFVYINNATEIDTICWLTVGEAFWLLRVFWAAFHILSDEYIQYLLYCTGRVAINL